MSLSDRQRIQELLLDALFKARKRVEELEISLAYNSALLGIGVDREGQLGAPPPELGSLRSVMEYLQLDPGEADMSDYLGIEGDDSGRPRLGDDAPESLKPQKAPVLSPNIGQVAVEGDLAALSPSSYVSPFSAKGVSRPAEDAPKASGGRPRTIPDP